VLLPSPLLLEASTVVPPLVPVSPLLSPPVLVAPPLVSSVVSVLVPGSPLLLLLLLPVIVRSSVVAPPESSLACEVGSVVGSGPPVVVSVPLVVARLVCPGPRPIPVASKLQAPRITNPTNQTRSIPVSIRDRGLRLEPHARARTRGPRSRLAPAIRRRDDDAVHRRTQAREFAAPAAPGGDLALALAWIRRPPRTVLRPRVQRIESMTREHEALQQIYQSTRGYCHHCRRKLAFSAYARAAVRGAWDIDAGALQPACATCLISHVPGARSKPARRTPAAARPIAAAAPRVLPELAPTPSCRHTLLGGLLGAFVAGPWGALLGSLLGAEVDER